MNIVLEEKSQTKKILKVEIPQDRVQKEKEAICRELAGQVQIPGFRAGKVPRNILETRYKQDIQTEILKKVVPEAYRKAIKEHNIKPLDDPLLSDIKFEPNGPLTFKADLYVLPAFKLPDYFGLKLSKDKIKVEDTDIDNVLKDMQEKHAQFEIVKEGELKMGQYALIDYEGFFENKSFEKQKDAFFQVSEDSFIKDFSNKLCGMKEGEERRVEVTLPDNYTDNNLAGKEVCFQVALKGIKEKKLAGLNDDFAKEVGESDTLDGLKDKIRENIIKMKESIENYKLEDQAVEYLLNNTSFELPENLVEKEKQQIIESHSNKNVADNAKAKEEIQKKAEKRVKTFFILNELINQEKIEVNEADLENKFQSMALKFNGNVAQVKEFYKDKLEDLKYQVQQEKVLKFLVDKAKIKEKDK